MGKISIVIVGKRLRHCCKYPDIKTTEVRKQDLQKFLHDKMVPFPSTGDKVYTLIQCDSCKTVLGRLSDTTIAE